MSTSLVLKISRNPKADRGLEVSRPLGWGDLPDRQFCKISPTLLSLPSRSLGERDGIEVPASPDAIQSCSE